MTDVYLWLTCGQSNNQGTPPDFTNTAQGGERAPDNSYPDSVLEWEEGLGLIPMSDNRPWSGYPVDYRALRGSAWPAFFNAWASVSGTKNVLVRCAQGGTSVLQENAGDKGDWSEFETDPDLARFTAAIDRATDARTAISAAGDTVVAINVLWHGGEADALHGENMGAFKAAFKNLVPRFRTALSWPTLKVYVARVGRPEYTKYPEGSDVQLRLADVRLWQTEACTEQEGMLMAYDRCILFPKPDATNPNGLNWMSKKDGLHYNQTGYNDMGFGMATFVAEDLGVTPPEPPAVVYPCSLIGRQLLMLS